MTPNEYQELAMRTNDGKCTDRLVDYNMHDWSISKGVWELKYPGDLVNGVMGLSGEAGEVSELVKKHIFNGHAIDRDKMEKELGDVCWYIAMICHALGLNLEDVMRVNIDKLKKRYPNGFSEQDSINRQE